MVKKPFLVNFHGALPAEGAVTTKFRGRTKVHVEGQSEMSEAGTQQSWAGRGCEGRPRTQTGLVSKGCLCKTTLLSTPRP